METKKSIFHCCLSNSNSGTLQYEGQIVCELEVPVLQEKSENLGGHFILYVGKLADW